MSEDHGGAAVGVRCGLLVRRVHLLGTVAAALELREILVADLRDELEHARIEREELFAHDVARRERETLH